MKKTSKKMRIEYKIAVVTMVAAIVINVLLFIFVLLPLYSLVGDETTAVNNGAVSTDLGSFSAASDVVMVSTYTLVATAIFSSTLGLYKDARKKPKK